jgi:uncharacterized integral membrane protein
MVQQRPDTSGTSGTGGTDGVRLGSGVIASLTGGGLLVVFMVQNRDDVTLHFLAWRFTWPLWLFTLVVAALGAFVWIGLGVLRRHRRRRARREARAD